MDYVKDFLEDVKQDRSLQLKTFITVVLSITGFSLFCVEEARLHRSNGVTHFTQVFDKSGEHKAMQEQRFPVITVCPTTGEFEGQIKSMTCSGYGPNSFHNFDPVKQNVDIGTISGATTQFSCMTVNEAQDYVGKNSSYFIKCDITYNAPVNQGQARITTWANHDVWSHAVFQHPGKKKPPFFFMRENWTGESCEKLSANKQKTITNVPILLSSSSPIASFSFKHLQVEDTLARPHNRVLHEDEKVRLEHEDDVVV